MLLPREHLEAYGNRHQALVPMRKQLYYYLWYRPRFVLYIALIWVKTSLSCLITTVMLLPLICLKPHDSMPIDILVKPSVSNNIGPPSCSLLIKLFEWIQLNYSYWYLNVISFTIEMKRIHHNISHRNRFFTIVLVYIRLLSEWFPIVYGFNTWFIEL